VRPTPECHALKCAVVGATLVLAACHKSAPPPVVLAQVGQIRLTLDDVREIFPPEYEKVLPREQYLDFIQRLVDDEVIFQRALKLRLDQDPKIQARLERLRRKALIEEFMARESANQEFEPDEGSMTRYYENHKDDFKRKTPEFRYAHIRVGSLKEALALRARVKGDNFTALASGSSLDSNGETASLPFRKPSEIPTCLLHDLSEAKPGWISPPLSCSDGVYLVKLLDRVESGALIPFAEAKEAIRGQLVMEQKDRMRETRIHQYREGAIISLNLDLIPGQETGPEKPGEGTTPPEENHSTDSTAHVH
jgi:peptidyl-prolyl cis-trans isomerase C